MQMPCTLNYLFWYSILFSDRIYENEYANLQYFSHGEVNLSYNSSMLFINTLAKVSDNGCFLCTKRRRSDLAFRLFSNSESSTSRGSMAPNSLFSSMKGSRATPCQANLQINPKEQELCKLPPVI